MKPCEWIYIETGQLSSSAPISLKRILLARSNFATYYPSIWTMWTSKKISRETNHFLKETQDAILGLSFCCTEIHHDYPTFGWFIILLENAILSVKIGINVAEKSVLPLMYSSGVMWNPWSWYNRPVPCSKLR